MNVNTVKKKKSSGRKPATRGTDAKFILKLFVSGSTPRSTLAIQNAHELCDKYLGNMYKLEVIDIYQQPELAQHMDIIAVPTLIKSFPTPLRRFIGDMSNVQRLIGGLELKEPPGRKTTGRTKRR